MTFSQLGDEIEVANVKFGSRARCIYAPMAELYEWPEQMFDVVMAGAIVEPRRLELREDRRFRKRT